MRTVVSSYWDYVVRAYCVHFHFTPRTVAHFAIGYDYLIDYAQTYHEVALTKRSLYAIWNVSIVSCISITLRANFNVRNKKYGQTGIRNLHNFHF